MMNFMGKKQAQLIEAESPPDLGIPPPSSNILMVILPSTHDRLQQVEDIWSVKQCPHYNKDWQRDVNACSSLIF